MYFVWSVLSRCRFCPPEQGQDLFAVVSDHLALLLCCLSGLFFWRTLLYILYDTSLYRLFEDFDSSCQFGSFPKEIHPKITLLLFLGG